MPKIRPVVNDDYTEVIGQEYIYTTEELLKLAATAENLLKCEDPFGVGVGLYGGTMQKITFRNNKFIHPERILAPDKIHTVKFAWRSPEATRLHIEMYVQTQEEPVMGCLDVPTWYWCRKKEEMLWDEEQRLKIEQAWYAEREEEIKNGSLQ